MDLGGRGRVLGSLVDVFSWHVEFADLYGDLNYWVRNFRIFRVQIWAGTNPGRGGGSARGLWVVLNFRFCILGSFLICGGGVLGLVVFGSWIA